MPPPDGHDHPGHEPAGHDHPGHDDPHAALVDYEHEAHRYHQGRGLYPGELEAWRDAVDPHLPAAPSTVLDLGCGTGSFTRAWLDWGARAVIALDPSRPMQAHLDRSDARVQAVTADGHALPLTDASVDLVWCSAVVHHLADPVVACTEVHRILRPGGRLLVRELCPDRSEPAWLGAFPGADKARARFPTSAQLRGWAEAAGLTSVGTTTVTAGPAPTCAEAAAWVTSMRTADSLLTALTDDEIAAGLEALAATPDRRLDPLALTLVACARPER